MSWKVILSLQFFESDTEEVLNSYFMGDLELGKIINVE
jgi:hypothetical protein